MPRHVEAYTQACSNASDAPRIAPNYLSTPGDRLTAARAIRMTRRIMRQEPLARYRPEEFKPGAEWGDDSDEALAEAAGRIGSTIFHPVGTARMGADDGSVVDPRLRVRGIEGLRVADASVMPRITSGNTNAPTIMIGEKAADHILGRAPLSGAAVAALVDATGYTDVELDLASGRRSRRGRACLDALLARVPAAEDALIVDGGDTA